VILISYLDLPKLQDQIKNGIQESIIRDSWLEGLEKFKKIREKYLLY
jgi:hypothetical protein